MKTFEWDRTTLAREVADRLIQYRADRGMTNEELADRLGVARPHVVRMEAARHAPTLATLNRLAQCLGMSFHIHITPGGDPEVTS